MKIISQISTEQHCQIRTHQAELRTQLDAIKASYENRLMELEENLMNEQLKCKAVIKARCDPLEDQLKVFRASESTKAKQLQDQLARAVDLERELSMERDIQSKLRTEISDLQKFQKTQIQHSKERLERLQVDHQQEIKVLKSDNEELRAEIKKLVEQNQKESSNLNKQLRELTEASEV